MTRVNSCKLPSDALLQAYNGTASYADCFVAEVNQDVDLSGFVSAFYKTPLFRVERWILKVFAKRPSRDLDVENIALGRTTSFAAWDLEKRTEQELLMCDMAGRTRSWFRVEGFDGGTRLFFGSAVVAVEKKDGSKTLGFGFSALLGFHKMYSVLLLRGAVRAISRL